MRIDQKKEEQGIMQTKRELLKLLFCLTRLKRKLWKCRLLKWSLVSSDSTVDSAVGFTSKVDLGAKPTRS